MTDTPDVAPDVASAVTRFATLIATRQPAAATTAMIEWVGDDDTRTRYFATTAATLVATRVAAGMDQRPEDYFVLRRETPTRRAEQDATPHDVAMCQVVVRIVNGEPAVAMDLLHAHQLVHGIGGLFWLGVFAVRMLAGLIADNETRTM